MYKNRQRIYRTFDKQKKYFNNFIFFPRLWINKANGPNFKHHSIVIRWMKFYWGYDLSLHYNP